MRISTVDVFERRWRLAAPLRTARIAVAERRGLVLRLRSGSGEAGLGEASPATWVGGESLDAARASLQALSRSAPGGTTPRALGDAAAALRLAPSAAFALETALLDLEARERGASVATLLAAGRSRTQPTPRLSAARLLASTEPRAAAAEAEAAARRGVRCFKLKVGAAPVDRDLERIRGVAAALPATARLRIDANRSWSEAEANRAFAGLSSAPVEFVEEPLADTEPAALRALRREHRIEIALDESLDAPERLERLAEAEALDVAVLKAARLGGLRAALRLADRARALGVEVVVTDSLEGPIGMAAAVALGAALPAPRRPLGLAGASLLDATAVPEWLRAAEIHVPALGLGVSLADAEAEPRSDA